MDEAVSLGYKRISDQIIDLIRTGCIKPGSLLPTERELVQDFGVSRSTVRRALKHLVESGWAESSPNRGVVARTGSNLNRKRVVGFIDHAESLEPHLFFTLGSMLQRHGLHLVHVDSYPHGTESAVEECAEQEFSAAIVWSKTNNPHTSRMTRCQQLLPIIAVDHGLRKLDTDIVSCDTYEAAKTAVAHLVACGRKRIGLTGMIDHLDTTQDRIGGYLEGMFSAGLQPEVRDMIFCNTSAMDEPDTHLLEYRLRDEDRPDAFFVMQDIMVPAVAKAVERVGLHMPNDIAFVTLGNDLPLHVQDVGVSVLAMDWDRIAEDLTTQVVRRIEEPDMPTHRVTVPAELIIRGSCGAPPALWSRKANPAISTKLRRMPESLATYLAPMVPLPT